MNQSRTGSTIRIKNKSCSIWLYGKKGFKMKIEIQLKDQDNPLEYTLFKDVIKIEYKYNYANKENMLYLTIESSYIAIPVNAIEKMEIQKG